MDTIPAQDIAQQIPVPQPPQKNNLRKFFNISSWVILFALLPLTVLIFLSQDSIPGDFFYPVKRGMENVILAAASVNPATRAAFTTDLTAARFKEAQSLVISKSNISGLSTFVDEVQAAQLEVTNLKNDTERKTLEEKLTVKIEEYQNGLSALSAKTEQNIIAYNPQENILPTSTPIPPTPTMTPSPAPRIINAQLSPQPSSAPIPTLTIAPTIAANIQTTPQESAQVLEQKKIAQTIKETKINLEKIKKDLEEKRNEDRQRQDKRSESETTNKEDANKKTETHRQK